MQQGEKGTAGFTIIETILFFALSGLMVIGILGSTTVAINVQRYRDAEYSLISYLQSEYDRVANVQNERPDNINCTPAAGIINVSSTAKGTSDCVVLGRLLTFNVEGSPSNNTIESVTANNVYGKVDLSATSSSSDFTALQNATPFISALPSFNPSDTYTPEWQTKITLSDVTTNNALLIVRSPVSGTVRTFVFTGTAATPLNTIVANSSNLKDLNMCLKPQGLAVDNLTEGVKIIQNASGQTGVQKIGANCNDVL